MRPHLVWRAALVAVLLVAGACGSSDGGGDADGDGPGGLRKLPIGAVGSGRSSATMSGEAAADSSTAMIAPAQPIEYKIADDADDPPDTATAYEVTPLPKDEVRAKVAKALDVDPDRIEVGVGGYDWYYSGEAGPDTAVSNSASSSPACAPDEKCADPSPPPTVPGVPSAADAEERTREILEAMGSSLDGRFEVFGEDGYSRTVQFTPSVDDLPILGMQTQVAFGGDARIEYASGVLAEVDGIGEYPLVELDEAVKRLQEGFGGGVRTMGAPEPAIDPAATSGEASGAGGGASGNTGTAEPGMATDTPACVEGEPCTSPPSPATDEPTMTIEPDPATPPVPLEPQIVEITGAELSLQLVAAGCPGDPVYLVPTFDLLPGPAASVVAVADDAVAGVGDDVELNPCAEQPTSDLPAGKPEPAPMPADAGREPATP